jgi:hypothetical protein
MILVDQRVVWSAGSNLHCTLCSRMCVSARILFYSRDALSSQPGSGRCFLYGLPFTWSFPKAAQAGARTAVRRSKREVDEELLVAPNPAEVCPGGSRKPRVSDADAGLKDGSRFRAQSGAAGTRWHGTWCNSGAGKSRCEVRVLKWRLPPIGCQGSWARRGSGARCLGRRQAVELCILCISTH